MKFKKFITYTLLILCFCALLSCLTSCDSSETSETSEKNRYIGKWLATKVTAGDTTIDFDEYSNIVHMELTIQFTDDDKYVIHYYTNGKEGEKYPQYGEYIMDGDTLRFQNENAYAEIVDDMLILTYPDTDTKQYFKRYDK